MKFEIASLRGLAQLVEHSTLVRNIVGTILGRSRVRVPYSRQIKILKVMENHSSKQVNDEPNNSRFKSVERDA